MNTTQYEPRTFESAIDALNVVTAIVDESHNRGRRRTAMALDIIVGLQDQGFYVVKEEGICCAEKETETSP